MKIEASSHLSYLRENISQIAKSCQPLWHPLGFVSCIIGKEKNGSITRIHYWPKCERRAKTPNWPIHTHIYDLSSLILEGRLRDIQYRLIPGCDYAIYSVSYSGEDSVINLTGGRTSIKIETDEVRQKGEEYTVPIDFFHQTIVPFDESAITLVVLSNFEDSKPLVLGGYGEKSYPYERVEFNKVEFWSRIKETIHLT